MYLNLCVEASWNVMAHAQKPDFVFPAKRTSPFKSAGGRQFSRLLAAEVCASAVVMLDTPCSEVVWRVLATHCIHQFPLHFPSRASPCAITFRPDSRTLTGERGQLKRDGTRAETRFRLSAKRTSPFKSAGGHRFSRLLAAEVCASAVVMLDTPCSEVVWRVLATDSIGQFPLHFPSRPSPCAITFQLDCISGSCFVPNFIMSPLSWKLLHLQLNMWGVWASGHDFCFWSLINKFVSFRLSPQATNMLCL